MLRINLNPELQTQDSMGGGRYIPNLKTSIIIDFVIGCFIY